MITCICTEGFILRPTDPACPLCANLYASPLADPQNYSHCGVCDLRFLHPAEYLSAGAEKARYLTHNNDVDDPEYQRFVEPLCLALRAQVAPGTHGLDFGAGTGPIVARMLERHGFSMTLYDPHFWPDAGALSRRYDFIAACEVVEHFYQPAVEFAKLFALLKPGAWLGLRTALVTPQIDFPRWYYRRDPTHVVFYSHRTFAWLATRFGFAPILFPDKNSIVLLHRPLES